MRIAILAHGTRGDIQPLLALGHALVGRGHGVAMTVTEGLCDWARGSAVKVVPMLPNSQEFLRSPEATEMLAYGRILGLAKALGELERTSNASMIEACVRASKGADLMLSTAVTVYRAQCIQDHSGIPHRPVLLFPAYATKQWASILSPIRDLRFGPANAASFQLLFRVIWRQFRPNIDEMCDSLGMPRYRGRPHFEDLPSLHAYSAELIAHPDDWDAHHRIVGWLDLSSELRAALGEGVVPSDLQAFLDSGNPPVFFGFGSMPIRDPERMIRDVSRVTAERGVRALIGAGWTDYDTRDLGDHVFIAGAFDHDAVLPRCRAAVHHGGSGTTGAAIRADLPAVIVSVFADQPDWGWRIEQAGVGATFPFKKLTPERLGSALDTILSDEYAARARDLGGRVRAEPGLVAACDVVEQWLR